jgi:NAD(P)-dependent dehydrogenase (short-subunit alcohol dehydrogenase family)
MQGKSIVVTGASSGIGAAFARLAGAAGAKVLMVARREKELEQVAAEVGRGAVPFVADVTQRAQVELALRVALDCFGRIDVWINNAGRGITRPVSELTEDDVDEMMTVNLKSALFGMQAVLPLFRERGNGHIINISSMLGRVPLAPMRSAYSAAKSALNTLTASLRMELQAQYPNIHVSAIHPGVVATGFGHNALHGGPDSRKLPNAQTAEQVANVIADVIERPRADVYTQPAGRQMIAAYYAAEDMGDAEQKAPFTFGAPAKP